MAAGNFTGHFKIVTPQSSATKMTDSQEMGDVGAYNNYTTHRKWVTLVRITIIHGIKD